MVCLPLESKPLEGRAMACLVHHCVPALYQCPAQGWGMVGVREVD